MCGSRKSAPNGMNVCGGLRPCLKTRRRARKEMRARTNAASIQLQLAYATAMLYTRHYKDQRRDHRLAKEWIHIAIALRPLLQRLHQYEEAQADYDKASEYSLDGCNGWRENDLVMCLTGYSEIVFSPFMI